MHSNQLTLNWKGDEWVGPVFNIDGKTAKIQMDSSQSVAVRLVWEGAVSGGPDATSPGVAISPTLATIVERIRPSVVQIRTSKLIQRRSDV